MKWISVKDRLPEPDGTMRGYLVSIGSYVGVMCFTEKGFIEWYAGEWREPEFPAEAWMPMPEPYSENVEGRKEKSKDTLYSPSIETVKNVLEKTKEKFHDDAWEGESDSFYAETIDAYLDDFCDAVITHIEKGIPYKSYAERG